VRALCNLFLNTIPPIIVKIEQKNTAPKHPKRMGNNDIPPGPLLVEEMNTERNTAR